MKLLHKLLFVGQHVVACMKHLVAFQTKSYLTVLALDHSAKFFDIALMYHTPDAATYWDGEMSE